MAKLLDAFNQQGRRFRQAVTTINISNNQFGLASSEALLELLDFQSPDNIANLRLSNLKLADSIITDLFMSLSERPFLNRLRLSGITLTSNCAIEFL